MEMMLHGMNGKEEIPQKIPIYTPASMTNGSVVASGR
jgi:hypothetical protein